jgi:hypothetical protein
MKSVSPHAWKILTAIGLLFVGWGFQQIFVIPTIPIDHWAWLTADPEAVDYFKLWLSSHGIWTATNGVFALLVAMTAFRKQEHWAW